MGGPECINFTCCAGSSCTSQSGVGSVGPLLASPHVDLQVPLCSQSPHWSNSCSEGFLCRLISIHCYGPKVVDWCYDQVGGRGLVIHPSKLGFQSSLHKA